MTAHFAPMIRLYPLLPIALIICAVSSLCCAQAQQPSFDLAVEVARAGMRADKVAIISATMNFSDKDGAAFWPVYQQYEHDRSVLDDGRVALIKQYTHKYQTLTDAEAKAMADQMLDQESRLAELKKKYYKKFNKVLPALTVAKFFQLERRIDLTIDLQVEASLPPLTQAQYTAPGSTVAEPPQQ